MGRSSRMKLMGKFLKIKSLFPTLELCHAIIVLMILMFTTAQEFKRRPFETFVEM